MASNPTPAVEWLEQQARDLEDTAVRAVTEAERRDHARRTHQPRGERQ